MKCCGNCEFVRVTESLFNATKLLIGTCRVHPPQYINMKSAWLYPEVAIENQPCINYKEKGEGL